MMATATDAIRQALSLDKEQPEVRLSLAKLYRSTGQPGAAVEEVRRVLAVQPDSDDAHRLLGQLLTSSDPEAARKELQRAAELRPQHWRNHDALGMFLYGQGRPRDAIDAFMRVAQLKPRDAMPFQQIGAMYLALNDLDRAAANFERSNKVQPNAGSYANLGTIAYVRGRYDAAVRAYQEAIKLEPANAVHYGNLGDALRKSGRAQDAQSAYRNAIEQADLALKVNPTDAKTASQLGLYYAKTGKRVDAERWAQVAERMSPVSPEILYQRAAVLALVGDRDAAVKQLSEAIAKGASPQMALEDDDLASLRSLPAFKSVITAAQKH
jgi:Flp pilus assembly protein TadD